LPEFVDISDIRRLFAEALESTKNKIDRSKMSENWMNFGHFTLLDKELRKLKIEIEKVETIKLDEATVEKIRRKPSLNP
jgi:hypothetical protein